MPSFLERKLAGCGAAPHDLALIGAAHVRKLGKQRSAFPGRRRSEKAASRKLGGELVAALSVTAAAVPAPPKGEPSLASPFGGGVMPKA